MSQEAVGITVQYAGPLFTTNIDRDVHDGLNAAINDLTMRGQGLVQGQLYAGHGVKTGTLRRSIHGGLVRDLTGQIDAGLYQQGENLEYAAYIEGVSRKNATSKFKGYAMFRQAHAKLREYDVARLVAKHVARRFGG